MSRRPGWLLVALTGALLTGACGDDGGPGPTTAPPEEPRTLTLDEATRLANTLLVNHDAGGAHVVVEVPQGAGTTLRLEGEIDWAAHVGRLTGERAGSGEAGDRREAIFDLTQLFEGGVPGVAEAGNSLGRPGVRYVRRDLDPDEVPVDGVLRLVNGLSADRADNPVLLVQGESRWLRHDEVDGHRVDVVRYAERTTHWIGVDDGRLYRTEATIEALGGTVTVTLSDHGPRSLRLPDPEDAIELSDMAPVTTTTTG